MVIVFGILGTVHFIFRKQFFDITKKYETKDVDELGAFNLWNFLFYISIGLAIVLAVRAGGVIPVFAYLVVPPVSALLLTKGNAGVVAISLITGVIASVTGIYFSVQFDFPAGASLVTMLGVLFVVASIVRLVRGSG